MTKAEHFSFEQLLQFKNESIEQNIPWQPWFCSMVEKMTLRDLTYWVCRRENAPPIFKHPDFTPEEQEQLRLAFLNRFTVLSKETKFPPAVEYRQIQLPHAYDWIFQQDPQHPILPKLLPLIQSQGGLYHVSPYSFDVEDPSQVQRFQAIGLPEFPLPSSMKIPYWMDDFWEYVDDLKPWQKQSLIQYFKVLRLDEPQACMKIFGVLPNAFEQSAMLNFLESNRSIDPAFVDQVLFHVYGLMNQAAQDTLTPLLEEPLLKQFFHTHFEIHLDSLHRLTQEKPHLIWQYKTLLELQSSSLPYAKANSKDFSFSWPDFLQRPELQIYQLVLHWADWNSQGTLHSLHSLIQAAKTPFAPTDIPQVHFLTRSKKQQALLTTPQVQRILRQKNTAPRKPIDLPSRSSHFSALGHQWTPHRHLSLYRPHQAWKVKTPLSTILHIGTKRQNKITQPYKKIAQSFLIHPFRETYLSMMVQPESHSSSSSSLPSTSLLSFFEGLLGSEWIQSRLSLIRQEALEQTFAPSSLINTETDSPSVIKPRRL